MLQWADEALFKEEANRSAVGLFPHLDSLLFGHARALVKIGVASEAQGGDAVIMGLDALAFAVSELVGMRSNYGAVVGATVLAW